MNSRSELLALRKQVLVARSAMLRVKLVGDVSAVRAGLRLPRMAAGVAASPRARSMLVGGLMLLAGRTRLARIVRRLAAAAAIARVALALWRGVSARAAAPREGGEARA